MKKLFALFLALVMLLSLAACGGNTELPSDDIPENDRYEDIGNEEASDTTEQEEPSPSEDAEKTLTPESFLALYGFSTEEITPNHFVSFDEVSMDGGKPGEIGSTGFIKINVEAGATVQKDYDTWLGSVWTKITELSKDGKLYKSYLLDEEATPLDELQASALWTIMPGYGPLFYRYNSSIITVSARYDTTKDVYSISIAVWG